MQVKSMAFVKGVGTGGRAASGTASIHLGEIIRCLRALDKNGMRRGLLALSALMVFLTAAALVRWAVGYPAILPWPILMLLLIMAGAGFVILMLQDEIEEVAAPLPATPHRSYKRHKPRGKAR